jgi:hypothetical protein
MIKRSHKPKIVLNLFKLDLDREDLASAVKLVELD